jgi:hypothetical protein
VQILWWLAPPVVATVLAMVWVAWLGREGRGQVDREVAVRRLSEALSRPTRPTKPSRTAPARPTTQRERSTGVAVRPSSRQGAKPGATPGDRTRRAS